MRVTNRMMTSNLLRNMQENIRNMDRLNNELATTKRINAPSDDPVAVLRSMQMYSVLTENEQYGANIEQALNWLETTDSSIDKATTALHRIKELGVQGASDTINQEQRGAIIAELEQLREHLVQIANTSMGGRYIFSGFQTATQPYEAYNLPYQGDNEKLSIEIGKGVKVEYSTPANVLFEDAFNAVTNMITDLTAGDTDQLSNVTLAEVDQALEGILSIRSELGAKVKRLELAQNRFEEAKVRHTKLISELEDVDLTETIMNLRIQETVYRSSLEAGARVIQPSLIDFIK